MESKNYDYIFLGAGCASLSILMRMIQSGQFKQKKILVVDKESKTTNDRTWCFWEREAGFFEDTVYHRWNQLILNTADAAIIRLKMGKYQYKMIRGIDFYRRCFSLIEVQDNIDISYGEISFEEKGADCLTIKVSGTPLFYNDKTIIFNSIIVPSGPQRDSYHLKQHFKGWIVESNSVIFDPDQATLMDFEVPQHHGTSFVYVLPLSPARALVEYTVFSERLLEPVEYNRELARYLEKNLKLSGYTILDEEFGVIPMTNAKFSFFNKGMYHIGTAGGETKPSTGYTFRFIQKQSHEIVRHLIATGRPPKIKKIKKRFLFYDSTLLHILSKKLLAGHIIFSILFRKNRATTLFKFLDNETSIGEEILLLNSLPKKIFFKAGLTEFGKMIIGSKDGR